MKKIWLLSLLALAQISVARADDIVITAEKQVEVHNKENKMVAVGNAVATQKDMVIKGEKLTAYFGKNQKSGKTDIKDIQSEQKVHIRLPKADAYGDKMLYLIKDDKMILNGKPAKIKNDKAEISAMDNITYYPSQNKAIAKGDVVADNGQNKVHSDVMEAFFKKDKKGNPVLTRVEIPQNARVSTKDGDVRADTGIYYPDQGLVKLFGNVTITQGNNTLKGDRAETDLNTGISKLLSGKSRVSGVWIEEE